MRTLKIHGLYFLNVQKCFRTQETLQMICFITRFFMSSRKRFLPFPTFIGSFLMCLLSSCINTLLIHFTDVLSHTCETSAEREKHVASFRMRGQLWKARRQWHWPVQSRSPVLKLASHWATSAVSPPEGLFSVHMHTQSSFKISMLAGETSTINQEWNKETCPLEKSIEIEHSL